MTRTSARTILKLPDGTQRELKPDAADIRSYRFPGESAPRFEIDGYRYAVRSVSELPFAPDYGGPARIFDLVRVDPPAN